mmetsp:Transcript_34016/g.79456  ORF Transcript_34016/g.79456 Transcript_34016/m.79456 type:complete len:1594 (-) Transcript_34016:73-4854(-)
MRRLDKLALHAQRSCVCPSDFLEKMSKKRTRLTGGVGYALFSSLPLQNTLRVPWVHRLLLVLAVSMVLVRTYTSVVSLSEGTLPAYKYYRFTSLEQRNGSAVPESPGIAMFGLIRKKGELEGSRVSNEGRRLPCVASDAANGTLAVDGASMTLSLAAKAETRYDMWFIRTLEERDTEGMDAVRFVLEGSDDEQVWTSVGSSTSVSYFNVVVFTYGAAEVPEGRGRRHVIDARMSTIHWLAGDVVTAIYYFTMVIVMSLAASGAYRRAMNGVIFNQGFQGVIRFVLSLAMLWQERQDESHHAYSMYQFGIGCLYVFNLSVYLFFQKFLELPLLVAFVVQPVLQVNVHREMLGTSSSLPPAAGNMPATFVLGFVGFALLAIRVKIMISAQRRIATAKVVYEGEWRQVCQEQESDVKRLGHTVERLQGRCRNIKALQLNPSRRSDLLDLSKRRGSLSASSSHGNPSAPQRTPSRSRMHGSPTHQGDGTTSPEAAMHIQRRMSWIRSTKRVAPAAQFQPPQPSNPMVGEFVELERIASGAAEARLPGVYFASGSLIAVSVLQSRKMAYTLMNSPSVRCSATELGPPVETLDQLHSQAFFVQDIFQTWVVDLARRNEGKFRLRKPEKDDDGAERMFEAWDGDEDNRVRYKLGGIKNAKSAMSKLDMAYDDNVSKLLDMCRETLYFESVAGIEACLKDLETDAMVDVVQVKNSMRAVGEGSRGGESGRLRAGMPFVKVNVRMAGSEQARGLYVDTHVCELLLVLTDIARLQTPQMYSAYKEWRVCSRALNAVSRLKDMIMLRSIKSSASSSSVEELARGQDQDAERSQQACDSVPVPSESKTVAVAPSPVASQLDGVTGEVQQWRRPGEKASLELKIGAQMEELLEGLARMSVLGISDFLDERRKSSASGGTKYGFETSSLSGLFYSSDPITAASTRWQFRIFTTALCLYVFLLGSLGLMHFVARTQDYAFGPYKHYRLETMLTRNGSVGRAVRGPGVSEFGLIGISGCSPYGSFNLEEHETPEPLPTFAGPLGSSFLVTYPPGGASMTGWYIRTLASGGSEAEDASYFNVWATNEDVDDVEDWSCALGRDDERWWVGGREAEWCGANWRRVGGTHWQWQASSFNTNEDRHMWWDFLPLEISLPVARDALETWQLIPDAILYHPWWILAWIAPVPLALIAVHSRHILLRPVSRFLPSPHVSITSAMVLSVCFGMVTPIYAGVIGANHIMYKNGLGVLAHIWLVIGITFSSSRQAFMVGLIGCGVMRIVSEALLSSWIFHSAWERPPVLGWVVLLLGIAVFVSRQRAVLFSKKLLAGDQVAYDALWQSLYESEDGKACVTHLEKVVRMIGLDANYHCQQQLRLRADKLAPAVRAKYLSQVSRRDLYPLFWDVGHWYIPGRPDPKSKVSSMNQLYAQSAIATLLLDERIQAWADRSSGMVRMRANGTVAGGQQEYARWSDVKNDPELVKRVKWPGMKRHTRALEKLFRSYENDPSLLLDISRNCLVFQNMSDLTNCLGLIITDDNVRVERLKNRMSPDFDTSETGGYRDVCINLKVVNKVAQSLGAELAICEVQLLLESFAHLKTAEGHQRYVHVRNSRAT